MTYYKFKGWDIPHLFTTKHGGVSTGAAAKMNLDTTKEQRENVIQNYHILCNELGVSFDSLTAAVQRHTNNVAKIEPDKKGNVVCNPDCLGEVDSMITNCPDITLVTLHADCLPIYFYDPKTESIGLAHAGWRGTVNNITGATITSMVQAYGTDPKNIQVGIGPGIRQCCFEVDIDVKDEFLQKVIGAQDCIVKNGEKYNIDLPGINARLLINAGIKPENIQISGAETCTKCNPDNFHSHRLSGKNRGCMAAMLALKK